MARYLKLFALILTVMIFAVACGTDEDTTQKPEVTIGELEFEMVDVNSTDFEELYSGAEFAEWYNNSYKTEGVYSFNNEEASYVLVCAGERNSGGYSLDNIVLTGTENNIQVTAELHIPGAGSPVTQAITYPNILLRIPLDERELAFDGFDEINDPVKQEMLTDSGSYVGQIDANSIEIKISGVPEDLASKAFQLDESLKDNFEEKQGLQSGDQVKFTYFVDEYERNILMTIEKL